MNDIDFLNNINNSLLSVEKKLLIREIDEIYPNIFILGLPRSGTTLLAQIIFSNLDVSCTNNLIAKFWKTPLVGIKLSEIIIQAKQTDYSSTYGKTNIISDPHEFSWFWHEQFKINNIESYDPTIAKDIIDWSLFRNILLNFNSISKKSFVHKPLELIGYHLETIYSLFEKGIFIFLKRPLDEIACSLINARLNYYNDIDTWWGSYPTLEIYKEIKNKSYDEQIAKQVYYLEQLYFEKFKAIDKKRLIEITYNELCNNPQLLLDKIIGLTKNMKYELKQTAKPKAFNPSKKSYTGEYYSKVITELKKLQNAH